jgi:hypothetical protein
MLRALLIVSLLTPAVTGCRRPTVVSHASSSTLVAGTVIDRAGSYQHRDATGVTNLNVSGHTTTISWELQRIDLRGGGSSSNSSNINLDSPGAPWFIHVQSPSELWAFDGKDDLIHVSAKPGGGITIETVISSGALFEHSPRMPAELVNRLPEDLRKLVRPADLEKPRPSF